MHGHHDAAGDREAAGASGLEGPAADGADCGLIELRESAGAGDGDLGGAAIGADLDAQEDDALLMKRPRLLGIFWLRIAEVMGTRVGLAAGNAVVGRGVACGGGGAGSGARDGMPMCSGAVGMFQWVGCRRGHGFRCGHGFCRGAGRGRGSGCLRLGGFRSGEGGRGGGGGGCGSGRDETDIDRGRLIARREGTGGGIDMKSKEEQGMNEDRGDEGCD